MVLLMVQFLDMSCALLLLAVITIVCNIATCVATATYVPPLLRVRREGERAPSKIDRPCDTVIIGTVVYFRAGGTTELYSYDCSSEKWSRLLDLPTESCTLAVTVLCIQQANYKTTIYLKTPL